MHVYKHIINVTTCIYMYMTVELIPCRLTLWPSPLVPSRSRAYHTPSWPSRLRYRHESMRGFTLGAYAGAVEISRQNLFSSPGACELTTAAKHNKKIHTQFIALLWSRYPAAATWCEVGCRVALAGEEEDSRPHLPYKPAVSTVHVLHAGCRLGRALKLPVNHAHLSVSISYDKASWLCSTSGS